MALKYSPYCRLAASGLVTEAAVRMAPMCELPQLLEDFGLEANSVIREAGFETSLFKDPENTIDFIAVGRLLEHTAIVTGYPYSGLELGRRLGLDVLGAVGEAIRFAPDVGTALHTLMLYFHLHDRGAIPSLWKREGDAMFGYTLYCPNVSGTDHIYDASLAIALNLFSELTGELFKPTEVQLFRDPPADIEPFHRHFGKQLRFNAQHAAIVFPATFLDHPLVRKDTTIYAKMLSVLDDMNENSIANLFRNKVRRLLRQIFISGPQMESVNLQRIARYFALHPRTLNRRLRAEGVAFNELLTEVRYELAQQMLRDTHLQILDIAIILGYAESASFSHAFRRWSGLTATQWRSSNS